MEKAFFFENDGKRLYAVLHSPKENRLKKGILFCHPYGEEKQRSCRIFVRFARDLCDKGFFVLRFDCRGYGDSQGDFEDATVETQIADTIKAVDILSIQNNLEKVSLLGLRWGGTIAALLAERDPRIDKLILWSPIIKGKQYVDELIKNKVFSDVSKNATPLSKSNIIEELNSKGSIDIQGYYLTMEIYKQLLGIDLIAQISNSRGKVFISIIKNDIKLHRSFETLSEVYKKNGVSCELKVIGEKVFWDERTHYLWYFPEELYRDTLEWIAED